MRAATMLIVLLTGCNSGAWEQKFEPPLHTDEVISAVSRMPECGHVAGGGTVRWRSGEFICQQTLVKGCSSIDPPYVEVVVQGNAWNTALAHELCHVCGYTDEGEAEACAYRARAAAEFPDGGPPDGG